MKMICTPTAVVMEQPDLTSRQIDEMLYGETCEVLDEFGSFIRIRSDCGVEGFIEKRAVFDMLHEPNRLVAVPFADLLSENRNFGRPMMTLPKGSMVDVGYSDEEKKYCFAVLPSFRIWYVNQKHLRAFRKGNRENIAADALSYLGTQYRSGGRTPAGIDDAGLACMAYRMNGYSLWRKNEPDAANGFAETAFDEIRPADLLYFDGHVGIYVGDGKMVYADAEAAYVRLADVTGSETVVTNKEIV